MHSVARRLLLNMNCNFSVLGTRPRDVHESHLHTNENRVQSAYKRLRSVHTAACFPLVRLRQCSALHLLLLRFSKSARPYQSW